MYIFHVRKWMLNTKYLKDYAKAKIAPDDVKQTRVTLFKATVIGERGQNAAWAPLCWNKRIKGFYELGDRDGILGEVCWFSFLRGKANFPWQQGLLELVGRPLLESAPSPPMEAGICGCCLPWRSHVGGTASRSVRKTVLGCRGRKRLWQRFASQRSRERVSITSLLKWMLQEKGGQGPRIQKKPVWSFVTWREH